MLLVPVDHGRRLIAIHLQTLSHGVGLVILAAHERARWDMSLDGTEFTGLAPEERALTGIARGTSAQAAHQLVFRDIEQQYRIDLAADIRQHGGDTISLRRGAYHPVQNRSLGCRRRRQRFLHDPHDHVIGDQIAAIHGSLRFETERSAVTYRGAEYIASGDLRNVKASGKPLALSPLARTRRSKQDNDHDLP